jgi:hypothetical protein
LLKRASAQRRLVRRISSGNREQPTGRSIGSKDMSWKLSQYSRPDEAAALFNGYSPRFVLSLLPADGAERNRVEGLVDAPFVGDGFTRWVDGQYALGTPELGLSNWQLGRLLGRSGILSGDGIHTLRMRAVQHDPDVRR